MSKGWQNDETISWCQKISCRQGTGRSSDEELETAKEELHSLNEELTTVNAELQAKVIDLTQTNNDMSNLMASTGFGTIFVDHQLRILRFTPAVTLVINLLPADVGRPVDQIVTNLMGYDRLRDDIQSVLSSLAIKEIEVQHKTGAWFQLRIRPYRTLENAIEGAVITFVDISEIKRAQEALREAAAISQLALVMRNSRDAIIVQDLEGRILAWNPRAERLYGRTKAEALAMNIRDMIPENLRKDSLAKVKRLGRANILTRYHTKRLAKDGQIVNVWLTATALMDAAGKMYAVATMERAGGLTESDHA